ncbi:MAG: excisionase family DNA-binding protein [Pseudomonadota bacterium]
MARALKRSESHIPNEKDIEMAKASSPVLFEFLHIQSKRKVINCHLSSDNQNLDILLSDSAMKLLSDILHQFSKGNSVKIIPVNSEVTTQEAADLLNVSRPFIIGLLEAGKISYKMVGTRRKVLIDDLMAYKESMYHARLKTLDDLTKDAQDLDMGY